MSEDTLNGSKDIWGKDVDTTVYQITYLHLMNIVNLKNMEDKNSRKSLRLIIHEKLHNSMKSSEYVQKSQASRCSATVLWCLDQQSTHQTGGQIQQKPAHGGEMYTMKNRHFSKKRRVV